MEKDKLETAVELFLKMMLMRNRLFWLLVRTVVIAGSVLILLVGMGVQKAIELM